MSVAEITVFGNPPLTAVVRLLSEAGLPTADLSSAHLETFFGIGSPDALEGVGGVELHGEVALLRSLAVDPAFRSRGIGRALVHAAEQCARSRGVGAIYLLTNTAARFFEQLGYSRAERNTAPQAVRQTREFASLCPDSAALMMKRIAPAELAG